jgi:hypothetical protein
MNQADYLTDDAPVIATAWSSSTLLPDTPIAPITTPRNF